MTAARHLFLTADAVGGVWHYSTDLARALRPYGYAVTLAAMGPPPDAGQRAAAAAIPDLALVDTGLDLEWLAPGPAPVLAAERHLAEMAADLGADIVQLHTPALASQGRYRAPVVAMLHSCVATWWSAVREGPVPKDFAWRTRMVGRGLRRADLAVAPSRAFARAAGLCYGVAPVAVHNGRALAVRSAAMQDHVFTAGRLWDEGKNLRVLDEAASRISIPFTAAGPTRGPNGEAIAFGAIHALGTLDEGALALRLASRPIFASAALYEPFGLAVLEAASAGCALVLSDIPTFRELWRGAALFVDPRDPDGFADAIERLIGDAAGRVEAGERAAARARRYTPAAMAARMLGHYAAIKRRHAA